MHKYHIYANGRRVNAIGIMHPISIVVEAESTEKAILKVYDTYEHLSNVKVTEVTDDRP